MAQFDVYANPSMVTAKSIIPIWLIFKVLCLLTLLLVSLFL